MPPPLPLPPHREHAGAATVSLIHQMRRHVFAMTSADTTITLTVITSEQRGQIACPGFNGEGV